MKLFNSLCDVFMTLSLLIDDGSSSASEKALKTISASIGSKDKRELRKCQI